MDLKKHIRSVPDFPKPGITFYDITTILSSAKAFQWVLDEMEKFAREVGTQKILGIESRGFIFAGALADRLELPLIIARKPGKLPYKTELENYSLEYGTAALELHIDAIDPGERILIVDDLIATGGTLLATGRLIEKLKGEIAGITAIIGLTFLPFQEKLRKYPLKYLVTFDKE
jgi:adenine phosphoribosyltransferase